MKNELKRVEHKVSSHGDFKRKYMQRQREVSYELAQAAAGKKKTRGPNTSAPAQIPDGEVSQIAARALIPPRCHIWRSNADGGWCGHYAPYRRTSFSGVVYGHKGAFMAQLRALWTKHCEVTGMAKSDVPILGLREEQSESSAIVAASSPAS